MLWTITIVFLGLWVTGEVSGAPTGFWLHLILLLGLCSGAVALSLATLPG